MIRECREKYLTVPDRDQPYKELLAFGKIKALVNFQYE